MGKIYTSLGLMSGTSMDGVDVSIIKSDGRQKFETILDKYFEYDDEIYQELINIRSKITSIDDLGIHSKLIKKLERKITLFHATISKEVLGSCPLDIDLIGFHGQTIFHKVTQKVTRQLGDGNLLSSLLKKKVIYNFRENDMVNEGQGAPLAPIFHYLLVNQNNIRLPVCILNIGGITNITIIPTNKTTDLKSYDIGPGNCLIDEWIRKNTKKKYDTGGKLAKLGKTDEIILKQGIENFKNIKNKKDLSFDVKDFDLDFVSQLSLKDGLATLVNFTATIISEAIINSISIKKDKKLSILICGGGRKNLTLINNIEKKLPNNIELNLIDDYNINGDYVESQAFAYLAIRSYLKLPISFPLTTNVNVPCTGGVLAENY